MIKEIRKLKTKKKQTYIHVMQSRGRLHKYINDKGYACYDSDELKAFRKGTHRGRPAKNKQKGEETND